MFLFQYDVLHLYFLTFLVSRTLNIINPNNLQNFYIIFLSQNDV